MVRLYFTLSHGRLVLRANICLDTSQAITLQVTEGGQIMLPDMSADQKIEFLIPYDGPWNESQFRVSYTLLGYRLRESTCKDMQTDNALISTGPKQSRLCNS
jgi:hypothetical protein